MLHAAVFPDAQTFAILGQLREALLLAFARLKAFRRIEMRIRHRPMVRDVFLYFRGAVGLFFLAAFRRGSAYSTEAGLKYFMLGAFASGLFLLGASLVYGFLGTTSREALERLTAGGLADAVALPVSRGFRLRAVARLFKLAMAPFHRWSPDVIEGSPASSTLFFAAQIIRKVFGPPITS